MEAIALAFALSLYPASAFKHETHCFSDTSICEVYVTNKKLNAFEKLLKLSVKGGKATQL